MTEKLLYTLTEVKEMYAQLIDRMGVDAGYVCKWSGVDSATLKEWDDAWWKALNDTIDFERACERNLYN